MPLVIAQELTGQSFTVDLNEGSSIFDFKEKLKKDHQLYNFEIYNPGEEESLANDTEITDSNYFIVPNIIKKITSDYSSESSGYLLGIITSDNKLTIYSFINGRINPKKRMFTEFNVIDICIVREYIFILNYDNEVYYCNLENYKNEKRMNINSHEYNKLNFDLPIIDIKCDNYMMLFMSNNKSIIYIIDDEFSYTILPTNNKKEKSDLNLYINQIVLPDEFEIDKIYSNSEYSVLLTTSKQILVSEDNNFVDLGLNKIENLTHFKLVSNLNNIEKVIMDEEHMFVILEDGSVYGTGNNINNVLGILNNANNINIFTKVNIPEQYKCINIYITSTHSIFLTESGEILYCGNNSYLNKDPCSTPTLIKNLPEPIIDVYTTVSMTYFKSVSKQLYISGIHNTHNFQIDSMLKINLMLEPNYIVEQVEIKFIYCIIVLNNGNIYYSGHFHENTSIYSDFKKLDF